MVQRSDYGHFTEIATRWNDNDVYGHINNVHYYSYFDTAINSYLIHSGALDILKGPLIGVCAESHCRYLSELAFPGVVDAGVRVDHLGRSSVRYGLALFATGGSEAAAEGWFVHVFVDRASRRPAPLTPELRQALERLVVVSNKVQP